jgi:hypothetical protein
MICVHALVCRVEGGFPVTRTTVKISAAAAKNLRIVAALRGEKQYQVLEALLAQAAKTAQKQGG